MIGMANLSGSMETGIENFPYIQYQLCTASDVSLLTLKEVFDNEFLMRWGQILRMRTCENPRSIAEPKILVERSVAAFDTKRTPASRRGHADRG